MNTLPLETRPFLGYFQAAKNFVGEFQSLLGRNIQRISSSYLRYNGMTVAFTALTVNFTLLLITDKVYRIAADKIQRDAPDGFRKELFQKPWVQTSSHYFVKSAVLLCGLSAFNSLVGLQLTRLQIAASIASTLFLQLFWKSVAFPAIEHCFDLNDDEDESESSETESQDERLNGGRNSPCGSNHSTPLGSPKRNEPPKSEEITDKPAVPPIKYETIASDDDDEIRPIEEDDSDLDESDLDENEPPKGHSKLNTSLIRRDRDDLLADDDEL